VVILCSGWKGRINLEDTICAGALAQKLIDSGKFSTICDATNAAMDLWKTANPDLHKYIEKASHYHRLRKMILDDIIEYCHTLNCVKVLPMFENEVILDFYAKYAKNNNI